MSDIEGKAAREAATEAGPRRSFKFHPQPAATRSPARPHCYEALRAGQPSLIFFSLDLIHTLHDESLDFRPR